MEGVTIAPNNDFFSFFQSFVGTIEEMKYQNIIV